MLASTFMAKILTDLDQNLLKSGKWFHYWDVHRHPRQPVVRMDGDVVARTGKKMVPFSTAVEQTRLMTYLQ